MNLTRALIVALSLAMVVVWPASADSTPKIVGRWVLIDQAVALQIQFNPNGTYQAWTPRNSIKGHWALVDDKNLATWTGEDKPRRVNRFNITELNLVITDGAGTHHVHRRDVYHDLESKSK
ncbi:MAG: hypothetical protein HOI95_02350 [Chromatiales bacterium]|jgi:hypothetical protein|nr:hypothetical protein [Chromatiales bacterium]